MGFLRRLFGLESRPPVEVIAIDDKNFRKEVIESPLPVLLDIWSDGCAPCARLAPIVMDLSRKYHGRIKVAELNSGRGPKTAMKLRVMGTPTVIYFHKGRELERVVGFRGQLYHEEYIDQELLPKAFGARPAGAV